MSVMPEAVRQRTRSNERVAAQVVAAIHAADASEISMSIGAGQYRLTPELVELITTMLDDVSYGREVTSAPSNLPIGTEVASELLGVSRPWLTTLLDRGDLPSVRKGTKRRIRLGDVLAYRRTDDARRDCSLSWDFVEEK